MNCMKKFFKRILAAGLSMVMALQLSPIKSVAMEADIAERTMDYIVAEYRRDSPSGNVDFGKMDLVYYQNAETAFENSAPTHLRVDVTADSADQVSQAGVHAVFIDLQGNQTDVQIPVNQEEGIFRTSLQNALGTKFADGTVFSCGDVSGETYYFTQKPYDVSLTVENCVLSDLKTEVNSIGLYEGDSVTFYLDDTSLESLLLETEALWGWTDGDSVIRCDKEEDLEIYFNLTKSEDGYGYTYSVPNDPSEAVTLTPILAPTFDLNKTKNLLDTKVENITLSEANNYRMVVTNKDDQQGYVFAIGMTIYSLGPGDVLYIDQDAIAITDEDWDITLKDVGKTWKGFMSPKIDLGYALAAQFLAQSTITVGEGININSGATLKEGAVFTAWMGDTVSVTNTNSEKQFTMKIVDRYDEEHDILVGNDVFKLSEGQNPGEYSFIMMEYDVLLSAENTHSITLGEGIAFENDQLGTTASFYTGQEVELHMPNNSGVYTFIAVKESGEEVELEYDYSQNTYTFKMPDYDFELKCTATYTVEVGYQESGFKFRKAGEENLTSTLEVQVGDLVEVVFDNPANAPETMLVYNQSTYRKMDAVNENGVFSFVVTEKHCPTGSKFISIYRRTSSYYQTTINTNPETVIYSKSGMAANFYVYFEAQPLPGQKVLSYKINGSDWRTNLTTYDNVNYSISVYTSDYDENKEAVIELRYGTQVNVNGTDEITVKGGHVLQAVNEGTQNNLMVSFHGAEDVPISVVRGTPVIIVAPGDETVTWKSRSSENDSTRVFYKVQTVTAKDATIMEVNGTAPDEPVSSAEVLFGDIVKLTAEEENFTGWKATAGEVDLTIAEGTLISGNTITFKVPESGAIAVEALYKEAVPEDPPVEVSAEIETSLLKNKPYMFKAGKTWKVSGEITVYQGGIIFYTSQDTNVIFE